MKLYLVQHGLAKSAAEDPDRSLTGAGAREVEAMADRLRSAGIPVSEIRHSGKRRAEQTAQIFADRLSPPKGTSAVPGLKPKDDTAPVAEVLTEADDGVMIVGHLPFLSRLASLLLTGSPDTAVVRFRNAGVVALGNEDGVWVVEWMIVPDPETA